MAQNWLMISVTLLGGHGEELSMPPGRVLLVTSDHTFRDLADAVDAAFARWDRAHLCTFVLPDGSQVTDAETLDELDVAGHDLERTKVGAQLSPGTEFKYVFDLGDQWVHSCTVMATEVDPVEAYGELPPGPVAVDGWGDIPDQYGRRTRGEEDEASLPRRGRHPMLEPDWPESAPPPVDRTELRIACARAEPGLVVAALAGHRLDGPLQAIGQALEVALVTGDDRARPLAAEVVLSLRTRGWCGDDVLAEDLKSLLDGGQLEGRTLPVDLEELTTVMEGSFGESGGYLDLRTGEAIQAFQTDTTEVGEEYAVDVDEDPARWLDVPSQGSKEGWRDMALFIATLRDHALQERLERAIESRGAFRRFKNEVHEAGIAEEWYNFSDDRKTGRARDFLADNGIRVLPRVAV